MDLLRTVRISVSWILGIGSTRESSIIRLLNTYSQERRIKHDNLPICPKREMSGKTRNQCLFKIRLFSPTCTLFKYNFPICNYSSLCIRNLISYFSLQIKN